MEMQHMLFKMSIPGLYTKFGRHKSLADGLPHLFALTNIHKHFFWGKMIRNENFFGIVWLGVLHGR